MTYRQHFCMKQEDLSAQLQTLQPLWFMTFLKSGGKWCPVLRPILCNAFLCYLEGEVQCTLITLADDANLEVQLMDWRVRLP